MSLYRILVIGLPKGDLRLTKRCLRRENRSAAMLDLPQEIRDTAEITFVSNLWQAIEVAFPGRNWNLVGPKFGDKPVGSPIRSKL